MGLGPSRKVITFCLNAQKRGRKGWGSEESQRVSVLCPTALSSLVSKENPQFLCALLNWDESHMRGEAGAVAFVWFFAIRGLVNLS